MVKIGAHVSAAGNIANSFIKAQEIGASCTQIFITPPQRWLQKDFSDGDIKTYKDAKIASGIEPNFNHGVYLLNLGSNNPFFLKSSIEWLKYSLQTAEKIGLTGTIFHLGSGKEKTFEEILDQVISSLKKILETDSQALLILENSAGAGNTIGDTFEELGIILKKVNDPRVKVCLDTQHAFVSGYDIRTKETIERILDHFDKSIGLKNLVLIHANDSKTDFNSKRDRHENIGEGLIGKKAFKILLNHPKLQDIPFILEVPGFGDAGPDRENVEILKSLVIK